MKSVFKAFFIFFLLSLAHPTKSHALHVDKKCYETTFKAYQEMAYLILDKDPHAPLIVYFFSWMPLTTPQYKLHFFGLRSALRAMPLVQKYAETKNENYLRGAFIFLRNVGAVAQHFCPVLIEI